jgi:excinuclease UvrABC nuclease subunit
MMPSKSYSLSFDGYWREKNIDGIPEASGVYCVYACTHNAEAKTVSIRLLIYIGEAENVNDRIANHEKRTDWIEHVRKGEVLCFNFAPIESLERPRVEAALIFHHKPPENSEHRDSFSFDETTISTTGKISLLRGKFTVHRTPPE